MMHLDIEVEDLDTAVADALTLGERLAGFQPPTTSVSCSTRLDIRSASVSTMATDTVLR
jgi:hypothetical protein